MTNGNTGERILGDSNNFIGSFSKRSYTLPSDKYPVTDSDSGHSVLISFKFYEHGKEIRSHSLRAYLLLDSNQYLDSRFLNVIGNYAEDRTSLFDYETCQVHGNSFYYDYRNKDSEIDHGAGHIPGYFTAMKVSNRDSVYVSWNGYTSLKRAFADTGETPHNNWYSGDMRFNGDAPLLEMWVIYGKTYHYAKTICN